MKKRIEQLLNGRFEYGSQPLQLSEQKIEMKTEADSLVSGSFSAASPDEKKVKGFLYSSSPRVSFDPPDFYGAENRIRFQADTTGLRPGDVIEGYFTLCTDLGEYTLPYEFAVMRPESRETGVPAGTDAFTRLAKEDPEEAFSVFAGKDFERMLSDREPEKAVLYHALTADGVTRQDMEEFLVGSGRKEPVEITCDSGEIRIKAPERSQKYSVPLRCSGWGYMEIELSTDSRFLRLEKKKILAEEFVGGRYELEYIVDTNFLHAGRNCGRIRIATCYQTLYIDVLVERNQTSEAAKALRVQKLMRRKMLSLYIDLRLKRIDMQSWIDRSLNVISGYRRAGGEDVFADLFLAQMYYADGKKIKAQHVMQDLEKHPARFRTQEQYAFYLYLTTFFQKDAAYVDQVEGRIEQLFLQNRESWVIQWILLYLQERYLRDDGAKLDAIRQQVQAGCASPIMYLEAAQIFRKDPYQLRRMDDFERRVMLFAAKEKIISEELSYQIANLTSHGEPYERKLFMILKHCYELNGSPDLLKSIISMLIAGGKKDPAYFPWYAMGLDADLRITGLYEYYMETMDEVGIEKMPQVIRMYFTYNNTLNYHKKAAIYRNISDNRDNVPQVYRSCRTGIDRFITEQLSLERIDENLAVLYERFITRKLLNRAQAERLLRLLFTYSVTCKNPNMKSVIVRHPNLREEQVVPLKNGSARVQIYTNDARILLADDRGNRYASSSLFKASGYLDSPLLLTYCRELVPENPGLILYICSREAKVTRESLPFFNKAAEMEIFRSEWRNSLRAKILAYYSEDPDAEDVYSWLRSIPVNAYAKADRKTLVSLLTQEGMYSQAFYILDKYGIEGVPLQQLVRICSQSVLEKEYEEDPELLSYCYQCYLFGKDDDNILNYLLMYYDGPIEEMKRLWNTGHANDMDTMTLEEKILSLMLCTGSGTAGTEQIFASYQHKLGRKKICRAYVILKSYEYLIRNLPVNDLVFGYIEQGLMKGMELEEVCELSLLRYYSRMDTLNEQRRNTVMSLLTKYDARGIRMAFYKNFPRELRLPLQMEDRVFLEYNTDPSHNVFLNYRFTGESAFTREPMKNIFESIFMREFILFDTEQVECFIEEAIGDAVIKTSDRMFLQAEETTGMQGSRYDMIGRISALLKAGDREQAEEELKNYRQLDDLTQELFTLI